MIKYIFIMSCLFVMSVSVFGQDKLNNDLNKSFKRYDLVKLDNDDVAEKAKSEQLIEFQAYGRDFEFVLTPNDLRSSDYRSVESSDSGEIELERAEVTTYKGKLRNDIDSEVRFTIAGGVLEGFIYTGNEKFFLTRARKFSKHALRNDVVVYSSGDIAETVDLSNDIEGMMQIEEKILAPGVANAATADLRQIQIATEADFEWVDRSLGRSASSANTEILGILNMVDGIYRRDLNLTISVTFQHAWSTTDPFPRASSSALLDSFLSYWNTNYPQSQNPRDVAHLFTGKFTNQGIAYEGIVCRSAQYSYGLTGRSGTMNQLITAHEIGHNLGAPHVDNSGTCANSIMNPIISSAVTNFCDQSKSVIGNFVATYNSCLSVVGTTTPTPTPSATPTPVTPPSYEGDVDPRDVGGNGLVQSADVIQMRRFVNRTDVPNTATNEFQRADSSPFNPTTGTYGDGLIQSDDIIQTRRFVNRSDALQLVGGPQLAAASAVAEDIISSKSLFEDGSAGQTSEQSAGMMEAATAAAPENHQRQLRVQSVSGSRGNDQTVNILVDALGDEAEYSFTVNYNQNILTNPVVAIGNAGGARSCNTTTTPGQIFCSVGNFPTDRTGDAGIGEIAPGDAQTLISVRFTISGTAPANTSTPVTLTDVSASDDTPPLALVVSTQNGAVTITGCTYSLSTGSQDFPSAGATGNVTVRTQPGCGYSAISNSSFITITSGAEGAGDNSVVIFSVAANSGTARVGTLTVAGQTFTVNQAGSSKSRKRVRIF